MKNKDQVYQDIRQDFLLRTGIGIQEGTAIDFYTLAVSAGLEDAYNTIEENRNPHIFTRLKGKELDDTGWFFNMPRRAGENDATYLYRLMNWVAAKEKSNQTAVDDALLNLEHSSNAYFVPKTNGCGTATIYIIPNNYTEEQKSSAILEVVDRIHDVLTPTSHIDFVIPEPIEVKLHVYLDASNADYDLLRQSITNKVRDYISAIPPQEFLSLGDINRIGMREPGVKYFNVMRIMLEDLVVPKIQIRQDVHTKLFLEEIIWSIEGR